MNDASELAISEMQNGDTGYTVPWAFVIIDDKCYIDTHYSVTSESALTSTVKVFKQDNRYAAELAAVSKYLAPYAHLMPKTLHGEGRFVECENIYG